MVFLPVLLSLIGPKECEEDSDEETNVGKETPGKIKNEFALNNTWSEINLAQVNAGFESEESSECSQSEDGDTNSSSLDSPRTSEKKHDSEDDSSQSSKTSKL